MINLIACSGKIGSGKDTVGKIIQYLVATKLHFDLKDASEEDFKVFCIESNNNAKLTQSGWEIKKFGGKLKQIVALLIGCTVEQLESQEFKSSPLGKEWLRYSYADGFKRFKGETTMLSIECDKETYDYQYQVNWQTAYQTQYNPRMLMQIIGTDLLRDQLLNDVWVNGLFADYKHPHYMYGNTPYILQKDGSYNPIDLNHSGMSEQDMINLNAKKIESNWIITDTRFPNEVKAIKERNGIVIRINRPISSVSQRDWEAKCPCCKSSSYSSSNVPDSHGWVKEYVCFNCASTWSVNFGDKMGGGFDSIDNIVDNRPQHESETALDNSEFDYVIDNNKDISHLIEEVRKMLVHFKIL